VGNKKRKKIHLAAGEEELLAAVVPPGDDLAAVQAHLQSKSGSQSSQRRRNSIKTTTKQAMRSRSIGQQERVEYVARSPYPRGGSLGRAEHDLGDAVPVPDHLQPRPRIHGVDEASHAHRRPAKQQAARGPRSPRRQGKQSAHEGAGVCGGALRCGRWHAGTNAEEGEEPVVSPLGAVRMLRPGRAGRRAGGRAQAQARALSV